jgi:pheromone shutdown protein TraB
MLLVITAVGYGRQQEVEILLVGTQHVFADSLKERQDFAQISKKLAAYQPEIICIESVPVKDAASLKEVRSGQLQVAERLRAEKKIDTYGLDERIARLMSDLKARPDDLKVRSELANRLYANHDFWNAYYHYFILDQRLSKLEDTTALADLRVSFALDSMHSRIAKRQTKSEYGNIVFPIADELGLLAFHNIDYRADEREFLKRIKKAAIGTLFNLKIFKLKKLTKQMQRDMLLAEQEGRLMEWINSEEQQALYLDLIDNSSRFLKSKNLRQAVALWEFRNKVMADRIIAALRESGSRRVMAVFGAFHLPFVKRYLEQHAQVKVLMYNDYMSGNSATIKAQ